MKHDLKSEIIVMEIWSTKVMKIFLETLQTYSKKLPVFRTPFDKFEQFFCIIQVIAISTYDQHMIITACRDAILPNPQLSINLII